MIIVVNFASHTTDLLFSVTINRSTHVSPNTATSFRMYYDRGELIFMIELLYR